MNRELTYISALIAIGLLFWLWETYAPARPGQARLRPFLWSDVLHFFFNGHLLGFLTALASKELFFDELENGPWAMGVARDWPLGLQVLVAVVVVDFVHWGVHWLLHRVPFLWEIHKVHHSIELHDMDWIASFRFHWLEAFVFRFLQYLPLAFFGFAGPVMFLRSILARVSGDFTHANIDAGRGWIRYVLNTPRMHLWHHSAEGKPCNFGFLFSVWDWIFGTAHLPASSPARLGFDDVERFPRHFFAHMAWPLTRKKARAALAKA